MSSVSKVKIGETEKTFHAVTANEAEHSESADSANTATSASQAGKLVNKLSITNADEVVQQFDGSTNVSVESIKEALHAETVDSLDHTLTCKTGSNVTKTFDGSADIDLGTIANLDNTMHLPRNQTNIADLTWAEPDGTEKTYDGQLDALIQKLNLLEAKVATLTVTGVETHGGTETHNGSIRFNGDVYAGGILTVHDELHVKHIYSENSSNVTVHDTLVLPSNVKSLGSDVIDIDFDDTTTLSCDHMVFNTDDITVRDIKLYGGSTAPNLKSIIQGVEVTNATNAGILKTSGNLTGSLWYHEVTVGTTADNYVNVGGITVWCYRSGRYLYMKASQPSLYLVDSSHEANEPFARIVGLGGNNSNSWRKLDLQQEATVDTKYCKVWLLAKLA